MYTVREFILSDIKSDIAWDEQSIRKIRQALRKRTFNRILEKEYTTYDEVDQFYNNILQ